MGQVKALVIPVEGAPELREVDTNLESMKALVGGGWLEAFGPRTDEFGYWHGYADEEGRLKGLPINATGTVIAQALGWSGDFLVGPVVILGSSPDDPADEGDIPPETLAAFENLLKPR